MRLAIITTAVLLAARPALAGPEPHETGASMHPAVAAIGMECLTRDFSKRNCAELSPSMHHEISDASLAAGVIEKSAFLCVEVLTLPVYLAADRMSGGGGTLARWKTLQEYLKLKAKRDKLDDCQKLAMANCVATTTMKWERANIKKLETAMDSGGGGSCTEFARFTGAILQTLGVDAKVAVTAENAGGWGGHFMLDIRMQDPAGGGQVLRRYEPQLPCGPGQNPCYLFDMSKSAAASVPAAAH